MTNGWNLEGERVSGEYLGEYPFSGVVSLSRVRYGGEVSHLVELDEPIAVYGSVRDSVIVTREELSE